MFQTASEFIMDEAQVTCRVYHLIYRVRRAYLPGLAHYRQ
jgi:hypothetical protein